MTALRHEVNMTKAVPFDTLAYAKKLESRGVEIKQAEAHAEGLAEVLEASFPTKREVNSSVNSLSQEIENLSREMNAKIENLSLEMNIKIENLRHEMNAKFAEVKSDVIKWVFAISFAQAAVILSILKIFH